MLGKTNTICVKKYSVERYGVTFLFIIVTIITIIISFMSLSPSICLVLFMPYEGVLLLLVIYEQTWKITIEKNMISKFVFFRKVSSQSFSEIVNAVSKKSYTDREYVRLSFQNGKVIMFRLKDENASKAVSAILSHRSIL